MRLSLPPANPAQSCPDWGRLPLCLEALFILGAGSVVPSHAEKKGGGRNFHQAQKVPFHAEQEEEISTCLPQAKAQTEQKKWAVYSRICKSSSPSLGEFIALQVWLSFLSSPGC